MSGIEASRTVYFTRRKATFTGRREIRKWVRSAVWFIGFCAYAAWTARSGLLELQPDAWAEAYDQFASNDLGEQAFRCAITAVAAIWAIVAVFSLSFAVRRRPWRPHSGGLHLHSPVWNLPRPRTQPIPAPYFPPIDDLAPLLPESTETRPDQEDQSATHSQQPRPPSAQAQPAASSEADTGDETSELEPSASLHQPASREDLVAQADLIKARCGRVFNLYSGNSPMRKARQSLLAVLIAAGANRAKTDEVAGILRATVENVRSLMRRAEKDGWVIREGPADWVIAPGVKTDFGLLVNAVDDNDEDTAQAIAATIGPPLPAVNDEWLDQLIADPTPRKELRLAAAEILNTAAEQWPHNPAWLAATDRLYGHEAPIPSH
ncbi:MAG: hypothetical protein OXI18_06775 [bacterium]|nr:hypothetical protein [bacterium]